MKKFLAVIKKYWYVGAIAVGLLIAFFARKKVPSFVEDYTKLKKIQDEEIERINEARKEEKQKKKEASEKLERTLVEVQKQYETEDKKLDAKKKREAKRIVKEYGDDPDKLAEELRKATGFRIILPED